MIHIIYNNDDFVNLLRKKIFKKTYLSKNIKNFKYYKKKIEIF